MQQAEGSTIPPHALSRVTQRSGEALGAIQLSSPPDSRFSLARVEIRRWYSCLFYFDGDKRKTKLETKMRTCLRRCRGSVAPLIRLIGPSIHEAEELGNSIALFGRLPFLSSSWS
jgi:hypothetical protein